MKIRYKIPKQVFDPNLTNICIGAINVWTRLWQPAASTGSVVSVSLCSAGHNRAKHKREGIYQYCSVLLNLQLISFTKSRIMDDLQMLYIVMRRCEGLNVSQGVAPDRGVGTRAGRNALRRETSTRIIIFENKAEIVSTCLLKKCLEIITITKEIII